jgi:hypothetical protein
MTKIKMKNQAKVQGEVVSGHIELNGQGPTPSHKSVKPVRAEDVIPGSYKKALLKSMAKQAMVGSGVQSGTKHGAESAKSAAPKVRSAEKKKRLKVPREGGDAPESDVAPNVPSPASVEGGAGHSSGASQSPPPSRTPSVASSREPQQKPEVETEALTETILRLADLVVPRDGDAKAREKAELRIRQQLATVVREKARKPDEEQDGPPPVLPEGIDLVTPGPTPISANNIKRAQEMLSGGSALGNRATAWRAECTLAASHLVRLLGLSDKQATDLYCSCSAVNGRGVRSIITAIRNYLAEQDGPDREAAVANLKKKCQGPAVAETEEFLDRHPRVRVDGFGFRHLPLTGEIFALSSETCAADGVVARTWTMVGIWGVTEDGYGLLNFDWTVLPEARFVVHRLVDAEDTWEYAALFGDPALPRFTVPERRREVQRQFDEAARNVDNQTPAPTPTRRITPTLLGPTVADTVGSVPGLSPAQVAAIVQAMQATSAGPAVKPNLASAGKAYRVPPFDEAREFQRVVDTELMADDLSGLPIAVRWRKATERAQVKWPVIRASFCQPVELNDDGLSDEVGEETGKGSDSPSDVSEPSESEDDSEESGSEDNSEQSSDDESDDDPDRGRERRRDKKRRMKAEKDRKAAFNSLGSPGKPKTAGAPTSPFVVVGGNDPTTKLERWTSGRSSNNAGFNWKAYQHHKQLYDAYMDAYGEEAPRTFRSIIGPLLIPKVCNDCGLKRSNWKTLSDATIILAIEKKLRPTKSSSFAADLKRIYFETAKQSAASRNGAAEPLGERFALFTEKYLAKVAEAEDAGRPIKERLVMKYFLEQLKDEEDLKDWLAEEKFRSLAYTIKRLTRKLKEHEGWLKGKTAPGSSADTSDASGRSGGSSGVGEGGAGGGTARGRYAQRGGRVNFSLATEPTETGGTLSKSDDDIVMSVATAVEVALKKPMEALVNLMKATDAARLNAQQAAGSNVKTSGDRGESWHVPSEHVVCYKVPCNAKFCQKCGKHGHVRAECKVPDSDPRANKQGYWCENNKGDALKPIYRENRAPGNPAAAGSYRFGGPSGSSGRQAARTNATQTASGQCL